MQAFPRLVDRGLSDGSETRYTTHVCNQFLTLDYRMTHGLGLCCHNFVPALDLSLISFSATPEWEWRYDDTTENAVRGVLTVNLQKTLSRHAKAGIEMSYAPKFDVPDAGCGV